MKNYLLPLVLAGVLASGCNTVNRVAGMTGNGGTADGTGSVLPVKMPTKLADLKVKDPQAALSAAQDAYKGLTMTDEEVRQMGQQGVAASDQQAKVDTKGKYAQRLKKLTDKHVNEDGLKLNFKVYLVDDINAFASPDGSIRVYSGLMDKMTDDELSYVIGHEIGHVKLGHSLAAYKAEYLARATRKGLASTKGGANLANSQLGALAEEGVNAQFSQEHERQADDYGLAFNIKHKRKPQGAVTALEKLAQMFGNDSSMFSSHPAPGDRAKRLKEQLAAKGLQTTDKPVPKKKK